MGEQQHLATVAVTSRDPHSIGDDPENGRLTWRQLLKLCNRDVVSFKTCLSKIDPHFQRGSSNTHFCPKKQLASRAKLVGQQVSESRKGLAWVEVLGQLANAALKGDTFLSTTSPLPIIEMEQNRSKWRLSSDDCLTIEACHFSPQSHLLKSRNQLCLN